MNTEIYKALNINEKDMTPGDAHSVRNNYFEATFSPPIPGVGEKFSATKFIYASLVPGSLSVLGRSETNGELVQLGIIFPTTLNDGTYPIEREGTDVVTGSLTAGFYIVLGSNGKVTFERDRISNTIKANFEMHVFYEGAEYHVKNAKLFVNATGPLDD
ncbi:MULTISPECIES: hypothetical protein [unclassified Pseudomonas]|uniref:hypothetical protein n=1 Tax=unclassified Pseudomonas TaxID=196821 RepID=UPI000A1F0CF1|nr:MULTISPECIES: hypothetical protein [unclassified Pseudomonas]